MVGGGGGGKQVRIISDKRKLFKHNKEREREREEKGMKQQGIEINCNAVYVWVGGLKTQHRCTYYRVKRKTIRREGSDSLLS